MPLTHFYSWARGARIVQERSIVILACVQIQIALQYVVKSTVLTAVDVGLLFSHKSSYQKHVLSSSQQNGHLKTFALNYARICFISHGRFVLYLVVFALARCTCIHCTVAVIAVI